MLAVPVKACVSSTGDVHAKLKSSLLLEQVQLAEGEKLAACDDLEGQLEAFLALREVRL